MVQAIATQRYHLMRVSSHACVSVVGNSPLMLDESPTGLGDVIIILMQSPGLGQLYARRRMSGDRQTKIFENRKTFRRKRRAGQAHDDLADERGVVAQPEQRVRPDDVRVDTHTHSMIAMRCYRRLFVCKRFARYKRNTRTR